MKLKAPLSAVVGNFVLFQLLWFSAVLGAAAGWHWPAPLALLALLMWTHVCGGDLRADLRLVLLGLGTGLVFEVLLLATGLIRYQLQWWTALPPLWIVCLWSGFAQSFLYSLAWLRGRWPVAALLGGTGAVMSLFAGIRFGAAQPLQGEIPLLIFYGAAWAVLVPWLAWLAADSAGRHAQVQA